MVQLGVRGLQRPGELSYLTRQRTTQILTPLFSFQAKDTEIRGTKFVVAGLKEGGLYLFRVRAVNAAGVGEPGLVSELVEVKDRTSKKESNGGVGWC